jgi:Ran GTPase-activating protein (RanGAP) involved in mRNA processing and transport
MRQLKRLLVDDCQLTDRGVKEVLNVLQDVEALENIDISGNLIGQSPFFP